MKRPTLLAAVAVASAGAAASHPIEKVINLLSDLQTKAEEQGKDEALQYQKFEYWCKNSKKTVKKAIEEEKATIESLEDKISGLKAKKDELTEQLEELSDQIKKMEDTADKMKERRDKGRELYEEKDQDLVDTLKGIEDAIAAIQGAKSEQSLISAQQKIKEIASLVQARITDLEKQTLHNFALTDPSEVAAAGDQESHVKKYSFKSNNVVELLKEMKLMFEDEQTELHKEETNAQNQYDLEKKARDNALEAANDSHDEKDSILTDVKQDLTEAEGDLDDTKDELKSDEKTLETTEKDCNTRADEWDERQKIRKGEIEAMEAAKKILAKVSGVRTEAPDNPVPPPSPTDFLQVSDSSVKDSTDPKVVALNFLKSEASKKKSRDLERLAQEVKAHLTGPFTEINDMIQKMIFRLKAEQKDEDIHKNFCDEELAKTEETIEKKEDKIDDLKKTLDDDEATVQTLATEIADAQEMVDKIVTFIEEATETRKVGHDENKKAIKDAQDAQAAIAKAIVVIEDYYKSSGELEKDSFDFMQKGRKGVDLPESPAVWESSYTGVAGPKDQPGGIVTVLEETSADFAEMEAETKAQEAADQKAFDEDISSHKVEKKSREKEISVKTEEKKEYVANIGTMKKMLKTTKDEKDAAEKYEKQLQEPCVEGDSSYEDRKAARDDEIEALKTALNKLRNAFKEDALISTKSKTSVSFLQLRT